MENIRVLELYSGIGGMHYALKESGVRANIVAAVDINPTTNQIYRHNFPDTLLWNKTIEGIPLDDFNKLDFDMILMSPPCQPFTRQRLYKGAVVGHSFAVGKQQQLSAQIKKGLNFFI